MFLFPFWRPFRSSFDRYLLTHGGSSCQRRIVNDGLSASVMAIAYTRWQWENGFLVRSEKVKAVSYSVISLRA